MTAVSLKVGRAKILAFRQQASALTERLRPGRKALRRAAWAGLQDSMPRAALLSIHARVEKTRPATLQDDSLVQLWGPRYQAYVVAQRDLAIFSLGRMPDTAAGQRRAQDLAARLAEVLGDNEMAYGQAAEIIGVPHNSLRYAATTGTIVIRWDGAKQPTIRALAPPSIDRSKARQALARRYLHIFGPADPDGFAQWAGLAKKQAVACFDELGPSLTPVKTPIGDAWLLTEDVPQLRSTPEPAAPARLLPSGDTYFLLHGLERELLVPKAEDRQRLWTSRVWPGAILAQGEIIGTWRRTQHVVTLQPWRRLSAQDRVAVETEAAGLPLPGLQSSIEARWE